MADTVTANFGLVKPEIAGSPTTWGNKLNNDMDVIDATLKGNQDVGNAALPKAGGVMTGQIKAVGDPVADEDLARKAYIDGRTNEPIARVGSYKDFLFYNNDTVNKTIQPAAFGCYVSGSPNSAPMTLLLPKSNSFLPLTGGGASGEMAGKIHIGNDSPTYSVSISIQDDDFIQALFAGLNNTNTMITLLPGEDVILFNRGTKEWNIAGGSWRKRIMDPIYATASEVRSAAAKRVVGADSLWAALQFVNVPFGATITPDFSALINARIAVTANMNIATPTNLKIGQSGTIELTMGNNNLVVAFSSDWVFEYDAAPANSNFTGAIDVLYYNVLSTTPGALRIHGILAKEVR